MLSVNNTLLMFIGKKIDECKQKEGWGSSIIPKLSKDIRKKYPNRTSHTSGFQALIFLRLKHFHH